MKITILCVGKIKEKYFTSAIAEYAKRLGRYCSFEIKEVTDEKTPDNASEKECTIIKDKEGARLEKLLDDNAYKIALCIDGSMIDSVELSNKIESIKLSGKSHIVFIIGGSLGLSDLIIKKADYKLSFSKMTFPHQLMRVILSEQIYRAFRISAGEPYHK